MAKGQMRSNREAKKPKAKDKKLEVPKYLRPADAPASGKLPPSSGKLPPQRPVKKP